MAFEIYKCKIESIVVEGYAAEIDAIKLPGNERITVKSDLGKSTGANEDVHYVRNYLLIQMLRTALAHDQEVEMKCWPAADSMSLFGVRIGALST